MSPIAAAPRPGEPAPSPGPVQAPGPLPALAGLLGAGAAAAVFAATLLGTGWLVLVVLLIQVGLSRALLVLLHTPAPSGSLVVALLSALVASTAAAVSDGDTGGLTGALALGFGGALVHQLARARRTRVTTSLGDTLLTVVMTTCAACLIASAERPGGRTVLLVSLLSLAACVLTVRWGDRLLPEPSLAPGSDRSLAGLVLTLGVGAAVALLASMSGAPELLPGRDGGPAGVAYPEADAALLLGACVAGVVYVMDVALDRGQADRSRPGRSPRFPAHRLPAPRLPAPRLLGAVLALAAIGPVTLLAGRVVHG